MADEMDDYHQGESDTHRQMVDYVRGKAAKELARWKDCPVTFVPMRAYYRGRYSMCVEILKGLGVDE